MEADERYGAFDAESEGQREYGNEPNASQSQGYIEEFGEKALDLSTSGRSEPRPSSGRGPNRHAGLDGRYSHEEDDHKLDDAVSIVRNPTAIVRGGMASIQSDAYRERSTLTLDGERSSLHREQPDARVTVSGKRMMPTSRSFLSPLKPKIRQKKTKQLGSRREKNVQPRVSTVVCYCSILTMR